MFVKFLLLYLPILPWLFVSANVIRTGVAPVIIPVNDSFVKINYQDAFNIDDFSQVTEIEVYTSQASNLGKKKYFAKTCQNCTEEYVDDNKGVVQPLKEGEDLLANINPCNTVKSLNVRISMKNLAVNSEPFKNSVDFIFEEESYTSWICYEDSNITKSQEKSNSFHIKNCINKVEAVNDNNQRSILLTEGTNVFEKRRKSQKVTFYLPNYRPRDIKLSPCAVQRRRKLLQSTSDWICVSGKNEIYYFKSQWEEFSIQEIYYKGQSLKNGTNNTVKDLPETLEVEFRMKIEDNDVDISKSTPTSETLDFQLTNCSDPTPRSLARLITEVTDPGHFTRYAMMGTMFGAIFLIIACLLDTKCCKSREETKKTKKIITND